jgi:hypothetical protein
MAKRNLARAAVAFHEAGHAVAAVHHRIRITKATIKGAAETKGRIIHHNPLVNAHPDVGTSAKTRPRIEHRIVVSFAGPIAQRRFNARTCRHYNAHEDYVTATNLAGYLVGSDKERDAYLNWVWVHTENFIEQEWPQVETVAKWLLEHETMTGAAIRKLVFPQV